ncbi:MAG: right-handed parallel beta-helix repeat-containing protein, partial [Candidatus Latescibacteria bacterium]|nr:right-handed parallel beta-helix repeat-containing protein [Candidatus Latescibacterota bacterium]
MRYLPLLILLLSTTTWARTYNVGPSSNFENISNISWETLAPGDTIQIHARPEPYHEKWVICRQGTAENPIVVRGIPDANGTLPIIDGQNATTRVQLNYWNEPRGIIKIGGANVPADTMPAHIIVENLDIRSGRPPYTFTGRYGVENYANNSAAIFLEKGDHITIRNCILRDCGNGFFCASQSSNVLVEGCYIYNNGIENRIYEHNNYTEATNITFQYNHFGPLRKGCRGNNLKDRSAGTVIRYNWIEDGNRQLDLVDSDHPEQLNDPTYRNTYVYGNILIESDGQGNSQIVHYGGDSRDLTRYRKGTLHFYNNTVVSTRTDRTTLLRLSSNDETCQMFNNIIYTTTPGKQLALSNDAGTLHVHHNWIKSGWGNSFGTLSGTVLDQGNNLAGTDPGFIDAMHQNFELSSSSPCIDYGTDFPGKYPVQHKYLKHQEHGHRVIHQSPDLGAYETLSVDFDDSGQIDFSDFIRFANAFGQTATDPAWDTRYDLNRNDKIDFGDFIIFIE